MTSDSFIQMYVYFNYTSVLYFRYLWHFSYIGLKLFNFGTNYKEKESELSRKDSVNYGSKYAPSIFSAYSGMS